MDLVIGASGGLGSRVVSRLLGRDGAVRASSRDPDARLVQVAEGGAETVQLDLRDPASIRRALTGVDRLVVAAHGLYPPSRSNHPGLVDVEGTRTLAAAAVEARVKHVVFCSSGHAGPDAPTAFGRAKFVAEQALSDAGLPHTSLRFAAVFMENHGLVLLGEPLRDAKPVRFIGQGRTPIGWLSMEDAADLVLTVLDDPAALPVRPVVVGPDELSRQQALALFEDALGYPAKVSHLPLPVARVLRTVGGAVNPGLRYLLDLAIAEETHPRGGLAIDTGAPDWRGTTRLADVVRRWAA